jgi:hypothetical protein
MIPFDPRGLTFFGVRVAMDTVGRIRLAHLAKSRANREIQVFALMVSACQAAKGSRLGTEKDADFVGPRMPCFPGSS